MTLEIRNLHKRFGSNPALQGMDFTLTDGELFGFVGSNGAGKTTTMRIMLGVLNADSGEVLLNGTTPTFAQRATFGYMPEERGLYPKMKVADQLIYFAQLRGLSSEQARKSMEYWTDRLGVGERRGDVVQALSLGNQQRVQLAAALVHNPSIMVLDEPFSGLDPLAVSAMSDVLREKTAQGATVVFSSHQLDLVERLCDRVGICAHGKMVAEGSIDELRTTPTAMYDVETGVDSRTLHGVLTGTAFANSDSVGSHTLGTQLPPMKTDILDSHTVRVELPSGVSDQDLLRAALTVGAVHRFQQHKPHLVDLFADVVNSDEPTNASANDSRGSRAKTRKRPKKTGGLFSAGTGKHREEGGK
ncbi:MAG: ATP-binding cassette domain-containing protein [Actinomycetaceae bacterium]|nr:ATP-binding cassette domain-containing protein [Arcanobacterium sp.]MDD7505599.1 ATP-binding cassette domain-containing protein [Actinomycetaceae bacterium]MDY6143783.1 ATP-binding cassette domain-containing protein [Arcanobacterium sp.]